MPTPVKQPLSKMLQAKRQGTDAIAIRSVMPSHQNPFFVLALSRTVRGEQLNGEMERLPVEDRRFLTRLRKQPASSRLDFIERELRDKLPADEQEEFNALLASIAANGSDPLEVLSMADVMKTVEGVKWLWRGWVPYGMLTEVFAEPGVGKSALVLGGIIRPVVVAGAKWPDGKTGLAKPQNVLWCDTESKMAETVGRITQWKLPEDRIKVPFTDDIHRPVCAGSLCTTLHSSRRRDLLCISLHATIGPYNSGMADDLESVLRYTQDKISAGTIRRAYLAWRQQQVPPLPERCDNPDCYFYKNPLVWNGKPLKLTLDHENGVNSDNRPGNLRLLCANCDSQLTTRGGGNKGRVEKSSGGFAQIRADGLKNYTLPAESGKHTISGGDAGLSKSE